MYSHRKLPVLVPHFHIHVSVHLFWCSKIGVPIVGIHKLLTDTSTWMWKLGRRPDNLLSRNICFEFSVSSSAVTFTNGFYPPLPHPSKIGVKLACNVNIVNGNLKSENSQDYAQKPQLNCTIMNSACGEMLMFSVMKVLITLLHF